MLDDQHPFSVAFLNEDRRTFEDFGDLIEDIGEAKLREERKIIWGADDVEDIYYGKKAPEIQDLKDFLALKEVQDRWDDDMVIRVLEELIKQFDVSAAQSEEVFLEPPGAQEPEPDLVAEETLPPEQDPEPEPIPASESESVQPTEEVQEPEVAQPAPESAESPVVPEPEVVVAQPSPEVTKVQSEPTTDKPEGTKPMTNKPGKKRTSQPFTLLWGMNSYEFDLSQDEVRQQVGHAIDRFSGGKTLSGISEALGKSKSYIGGLKQGAGSLTTKDLAALAKEIGHPAARLLLNDKQFEAGEKEESKHSSQVGKTPSSESSVKPTDQTPDSPPAPADDKSEIPSDSAYQPGDAPRVQGPDYKQLYAALVAAGVVSTEDHHQFLFDHSVEDLGRMVAWQRAADKAVATMARRDIAFAKDYIDLMKDPMFTAVLCELGGLETAYLFHKLAEEQEETSS